MIKFLTVLLLAASISQAGQEYSYTCTTPEGASIVMQYKYDNGYQLVKLELNGRSMAHLVVANTFKLNRTSGIELTVSGYPNATLETNMQFRLGKFNIGQRGSYDKKPFAVSCIEKDLSVAAPVPGIKF